MKILITGHTGYLGSALYQALKQNHEVLGFSKSNGFDLLNSDSFNILPDECETVIHCAAEMKIEPESFIANINVNANGALLIAEYARKVNAKLIFISSVFAIEHDENQYFDGYGATKRVAEKLLDQYARMHGLDLAILRLPQIYDSENLALQSLPMLYRIFEQVNMLGKVTIYGEINPIRNFLHIEDAISIIQIITNSSLKGIFNCPHPSSVNVIEIIDRVSLSMNITPEIYFDKDKDNLKTMYIPSENLVWSIICKTPNHDLLNDIPNMIRKQYGETL